MSTKNPLSQYRNDLFGSRGVDVASALDYVDQLANGSQDAIAVRTACHVLLNTVIGAVDQILSAPSPEKLALIELINQITHEHINNAFNDLDEQVTDKVSSWMSNNLDNRIQDWVDNNLDMDDVISEWMGNNFDITDHDDNIDWDTQLHDRLNDWMTDNLESKINDLDLVVRIR